MNISSRPTYPKLVGKPAKTIIILRNTLLTIVMISALSIMEVLHAEQDIKHIDTKNERTRLNDVSSGSLLFKTDNPGQYALATTVQTNVQIEINGLILRAAVTQTFTNDNENWVEGIYVFPLPENAVVDHLEMQIGARQIEGKIQERSVAKQTYMRAKASGKKASLVEQQRPNIFTNSVANIAPHESISITIEYQQSLQYNMVDGSGQFQFRFPSTITPRYTPASAVTPSSTTVREEPLNLHIRIDAGFPIIDINSPYHNINAINLGENQFDVSLADPLNFENRDFVLMWRSEVSHDPITAVFSETIEGDQYHYIMIMPPTSSAQGGQPLPREVIYIIDTSGSMSGDSIDQAKLSLHTALNRLRPSDKFNIIQFNSSTSHLFSSAKFANIDNLIQANDYIDSLVADGGTEMLPALMAALGTPSNHDDSYVRQILFLTDGAVGNESQLFSYIEHHLGNNRLFTIGIGTAPNSYFMTRAAAFGRGTFTYIASIDEIQIKLNQLFVKLESPILQNIRISWPDDMRIEAWPKNLPDLYLGEPFLLSVKVLSGTGAIKIRGDRANEEWYRELPLQKNKSSRGVAAIWARHQIDALTQQMMLTKNKKQLQDRLTRVAIQHHLVSQYTSLVAVDITPSRPDTETLLTGPLPLSPASNGDESLLIAQLANTATPAKLHLLIGVTLLLLTLLQTSVFSKWIQKGFKK
ncbi:MAG: VIT domain-containing protein [Thiohalomonadales bacterium]